MSAPAYPLEAVRARFPALAERDDGVPRVYLDAPAGTQVPASVASAVADTLLRSNANLGGAFRTSQAAQGVVDDARRAMADFMGASDPDEIVIGPSMTTLTMHLSRSLARTFAPGDEIVVTRMDHEGNVAPWLEIAKDHDLVVKWAAFDRESWSVEPHALAAAMSGRTRLVALNYASNLTGAINDIPALTRLAKSAGALVYVDAVQLAPHRLLDVAALGCDFVVCSAYKFYGPHLGVLWGRRAVLEGLPAVKCRCTSDATPDRFETGTPQIELLAGLSAAVDHWAWLGAQVGEKVGAKVGAQIGGAVDRRAHLAAAAAATERHESALSATLIAGLRALPGVEIYGHVDPAAAAHRVPTVSCRHARTPPQTLAAALAAENVFVWDGHNYALEVVRHLSVPEDEGVLRIGAAQYTTPAEIDRTLEILESQLVNGSNGGGAARR